MCGILTVIQKKHKTLDASLCRRALSYLSWRGPDLSVSSVWKDFVFIGHNVLSLTGSPSNRRNEYSISKNRRYKVAFNGEIYNFKELAEKWLKNHIVFDSDTTDTEILVNLYEIFSPEKVPLLLDGMYAYTILDQLTGELYVVRDSQGEKSLYIFEDEELIIIASELTAIKSIVGKMTLDKQALRDYFNTRHFMLFSRTSFQKIRQILPGYTECFDVYKGDWTIVASRSISDWINPNLIEKNSERTLDDLADELDSLLINETKKMLPKGDYAAVTSGGIDSSLLSYYLNTYGEPKIFVAVNNLGKDLISSDLSDFEKILKRKIDVVPVDKRIYAGEITRCQQRSASPLCSHSYVTQAIQSHYVRTAGCPIIFGGEGGDELFGGYDAYLNPSKLTEQFSPSPYTGYIPTELEFLENDPKTIKEELGNAWRSAVRTYDFIADKEHQNVYAMMLADSAFQLPSVGLRGSDIMSMMWSVESRSIFLSKNIVSFALNLPLKAKIDRDNQNPNLRTKILLKKLFQRYFPEKLIYKKQGFTGFPNESGEYLGNVEDYMVFDTLGIKKPSQKVFNRETNWKLINLEYFLRQEKNHTNF